MMLVFRHQRIHSHPQILLRKAAAKDGNLSESQGITLSPPLHHPIEARTWTAGGPQMLLTLGSQHPTPLIEVASHGWSGCQASSELHTSVSGKLRLQLCPVVLPLGLGSWKASSQAGPACSSLSQSSEDLPPELRDCSLLSMVDISLIPEPWAGLDSVKPKGAEPGAERRQGA